MYVVPVDSRSDALAARLARELPGRVPVKACATSSFRLDLAAFDRRREQLDGVIVSDQLARAFQDARGVAPATILGVTALDIYSSAFARTSSTSGWRSSSRRSRASRSSPLRAWNPARLGRGGWTRWRCATSASSTSACRRTRARRPLSDLRRGAWRSSIGSSHSWRTLPLRPPSSTPCGRRFSHGSERAHRNPPGRRRFRAFRVAQGARALPRRDARRARRGGSCTRSATRCWRSGSNETLSSCRFPFSDDGTDERAAVHGLIAGLRAASNDVCDRAAGRLSARDVRGAPVSRRGGGRPADGAVARRLLEGDAPRARGAGRAWRALAPGRQPDVLELDESLLENVNTRMELMTAAVADWAREKDDVRTLLLVGSQARAEVPADRWSDLDLIFIVEDPSVYHDDASWIARVRGAAGDLSGAQARRSLGPAGALRDRRGGGLRVLSRLGPRTLRCERKRRRTPGPRLPAARRPSSASRMRSSGAQRGRDPQVRRSTTSTSSPATSGTTRSGPRRSSGAARSSPRSNVSTGT